MCLLFPFPHYLLALLVGGTPAFYKIVMPGLHASERLHFNYNGVSLRQQSTNATTTTQSKETIQDKDTGIPMATDFYCFNPDCIESSNYEDVSQTMNESDNNQQSAHQQYQRQQGSPYAINDLFSRHDQWVAHHPDIVPHPKAEERVLPRRVPHYIEVLLDLPESEQNQNMGMFGVLVELESSNRTVLASSLRWTRFPHESRWISIIRKGFCIVPLMLGALQESRRVLVPSFRFFVESEALPLVRC